jgi:hypothetical protein
MEKFNLGNIEVECTAKTFLKLVNLFRSKDFKTMSIDNKKMFDNATLIDFYNESNENDDLLSILTDNEINLTKMTKEGLEKCPWCTK